MIEVIKHGTYFLNDGKSIECPECGSKYVHFSDYETGKQKHFMVCEKCRCIFVIK